MFSISDNNVITITRGDSASFTLYLNKGTNLEPEKYILKAGDAVYMGIMEANQRFEDAIVKYKFTSEDLDVGNNVKIKIKATDTEYLEPDKYFYQVKLVYLDEDNDEQVSTVISKTPFFVQD